MTAFRQVGPNQPGATEQDIASNESKFANRAIAANPQLGADRVRQMLSDQAGLAKSKMTSLRDATGDSDTAKAAIEEARETLAKQRQARLLGQTWGQYQASQGQAQAAEQALKHQQEIDKLDATESRDVEGIKGKNAKELDQQKGGRAIELVGMEHLEAGKAREFDRETAKRLEALKQGNRTATKRQEHIDKLAELTLETQLEIESRGGTQKEITAIEVFGKTAEAIAKLGALDGTVRMDILRNIGEKLGFGDDQMGKIVATGGEQPGGKPASPPEPTPSQPTKPSQSRFLSPELAAGAATPPSAPTKQSQLQQEPTPPLSASDKRKSDIKAWRHKELQRIRAANKLKSRQRQHFGNR